MAKNTENANTETANSETKPTDFIAKIGRNLNMGNAKELFGDNALEALKAVARAGRFGSFDDAVYLNPLFGGLAIPQGDDFIERRAAINAALNELK